MRVADSEGKGAAGGAAVGTVAGGIIGNQTGSTTTSEYNQTLSQGRGGRGQQRGGAGRWSGESAHRDRGRRECGHARASARAHPVTAGGNREEGFIENIEDRTAANSDFRRVIHTAQHMQREPMSLGAGEEIGEEVHAESDQFFRIETGAGEVWMNGIATAITDGCAIVIPAGVRNNIRNTGCTALQVYTLYAPPHHADGTVHATRADANGAEEHFAGKTTESRRPWKQSAWDRWVARRF